MSLPRIAVNPSITTIKCNNILCFSDSFPIGVKSVKIKDIFQTAIEQKHCKFTAGD